MHENPYVNPEENIQFDNMTMEELEHILRQDAEARDSTDVDALMRVAEVIRSRKEPDPNRKTPEEAFEIFKNLYLNDAVPDQEAGAASEKKDHSSGKGILRRRWLRRLVSAAAVVAVLVVSGIASNVTGYNFWERIVHWGKESFNLVGNDVPDTPHPSKDDQQDYQTLQEALELYDITVPLAPKWIPERYEQTRIKVKVSPVQELFVGIYESGEKMMKIQIARYLEGDPINYDQDGTLVEEYEVRGVRFHLFAGEYSMLAVWSIDDFECSISGDLTMEEMKKMLDSIME